MSFTTERMITSGFQQIAKTTSNLLDPLTYFAQENLITRSPAVSVVENSSSPFIGVIGPLRTFSSEEELTSSEKKNESEKSSEIKFKFLTGESQLMNIKNVMLNVTNDRVIKGTLMMTNYRVSFISWPQSAVSQSGIAPPWASVPLACMEKIEKETTKGADPKTITGTILIITCKDVRQIRLSIPHYKQGESDLEKAYNVLRHYAFTKRIELLFAFSHAICFLAPLVDNDVTESYTEAKEFSRLGLLEEDASSSPWRICDANTEYRLCESYPQFLVMPAALTDEDLFSVASFRSLGRLPAMCWRNRINGATLWRSSQPKAGMSGSNVLDERFLYLLALSAASNREPALFIVDCRPQTSALANRATGHGYESQGNYPNSRLEFYNIPNIHGVKQSYQKIASLVLTPNNDGDPYFQKKIEDTNWLANIRLLLKAGLETAQHLARGSPVLVHCSHGWDRTAQVCSLAEILLDPYYRSMHGFKVLIEKEWCSFGHPFQMRCAHIEDPAVAPEDQAAPIFIQFLDCVWQLLHIYPHWFEFNSRYLLVLAGSLFDARYSTFLFSCHRDRARFAARPMTEVWTYIHLNRRYLMNPHYVQSNLPVAIDLPSAGVLLRNVTFWGDYFYRYSLTSSMPPLDSQLRDLLFDEHGMCRPSIPRSSPLFKSSSSKATVPTASADIDLPAMSTSDDAWSAIYLRVCMEKEVIEDAMQRQEQAEKLFDTTEKTLNVTSTSGTIHPSHTANAASGLQAGGSHLLDLTGALAASAHCINGTPVSTNESNNEITEEFNSVESV